MLKLVALKATQISCNNWLCEWTTSGSSTLYVYVSHVIDIGVLLAELSFVLHNGLQLRKIPSDLQRRSKLSIRPECQINHTYTHWQADIEQCTCIAPSELFTTTGQLEVFLGYGYALFNHMHISTSA